MAGYLRWGVSMKLWYAMSHPVKLWRSGILARMKWYRVVLDEAQVVRNHLTQSAQCIFRLQTKYRWCLSGTPIFNGVADIFSYLRFCRPGYYNWDLFSMHIVRCFLLISRKIIYVSQCRIEKRDIGAAGIWYSVLKWTVESLLRWNLQPNRLTSGWTHWC